MPVVPVVRNVLRGRIRAQAQYQVILGDRLVAAYLKNPDLLLFNGASGPGSWADFNICLEHIAIALITRA